MSREPNIDDANFVASLHHADNWTRAVVQAKGPINPGDFATQNQECPAAIRARNAACSPIAWFHPNSHGETL